MVVDTVQAASDNGRTVKSVTMYRAVLGVSIVANLVVGVFIFGWPDAFAHLMGQPEAFPKGWPRHWGMQLWAINLLYLPGFRDPEQNRWPNWLGIAIRLTFAAFFFSQGNGFTPMGIYDATSGVLLLMAYLPVTRVTRLPS